MTDDRIHMANRAKAAMALADLLAARNVAPDDAAGWGQSDRSALGHEAGLTKPPSPETWSSAVAVLRRRLAEAPTDPFAGLPS